MGEYKSLRDWIYIKHHPSRGMYQRHSRQNIYQEIPFQNVEKVPLFALYQGKGCSYSWLLREYLFCVVILRCSLLQMWRAHYLILVLNSFVNTSPLPLNLERQRQRQLVQAPKKIYKYSLKGGNLRSWDLCYVSLINTCSRQSLAVNGLTLGRHGEMFWLFLRLGVSLTTF